MASGRGLPSVLRTQTYERPERQDINTDIMFPVSVNQNSVRFVFNRTGVLDSNSQINLRQTCNQVGGAEQLAVVPTSTGALAMVERAYLTIGGRRVSTLERVGHYSTWKRLHWSQEYKEGIAKPKQGGDDCFYGSAARGIEPIIPASQTKINARGFVSPYGQLGRRSDEYAKSLVTGLMSSTETDSQTDAGKVITSDPATSPDFSVGISQLIPFLVGVQLPLFAIREEVALTIEFAPNTFGHRFVLPQATAVNEAVVFSTIVTSECYLMVDYLYFPDQLQMLTEEMMQGGGYDIAYDEVQVIENTEDALVAGQTALDIQLPMGGKKVKSVVMQQQRVDAAGQSYPNIGRYTSVALGLGQSLNLWIDSTPFYNKNITNQSLMLQEANEVEGVPLQLPNYKWAWTNQVNAAGVVTKPGLSDRLFNGYANQEEAATAQFLGVKLENAVGQGIRISNLPMIWKRAATIPAGDAGRQFLLRFFIKTQRLLNISNGIVHMIE